MSAATAWELGLKVSLGKLRLPESVEDGIVAAGFKSLTLMTHNDKVTHYEVAVFASSVTRRG